MRFRLASSPHQHIRRDTGQVMRLVILAMVPGILMQTWFFGWGTIIQIVLAVITAIVTEAVILELRKRDFERALKDYSAVLAAILLAVSISPFAPWWVIVIGTFFAIGVVKQLYYAWPMQAGLAWWGHFGGLRASTPSSAPGKPSFVSGSDFSRWRLMVLGKKRCGVLF